MAAPAMDPRPDYILVVSTAIAPGSNRVAASSALATEYKDLVQLLASSGLEVTGRRGASGSDTVLVFVRAKEGRVREESHRERLSDWVHGVASSSSRSSPRTGRDFEATPLQPAERLRLVYSILTAPALLPLLPSKRFPSVKSIFPPHDQEFNKQWMAKWSSRSHFLVIPPGELTAIKDQLGEAIALYFSFLKFYFVALAFPAFLGTIWWATGSTYSPSYGVTMSIWAVVFVETWRIKERTLAVQWGTYGFEEVETLRPQFKGIPGIDGNGDECLTFPWYQTLLRQVATIPVLLVFASVMTGVITSVYSIDTVVGEVYAGPGKMFLALIPTVLFAGLVPQVTKLWAETAKSLTTWENHAHQTQHDNSLTKKVFALNFFVAYESLLLTSYIYIPFGSILVPHILALLPLSIHPHHIVSTAASARHSFSVNTQKLHTQIVAYTLTNQIVQAFTVIAIPIALRMVNREVSKRKRVEVAGVDREEEKAFLESVRFQATLPEYSLFFEYSQMTLQFGYLVMFSVIWPVAPLWSCVNNFFELRSDAYKLVSESRRPVPSRSTTIGPWLEVLGFITWFGTLTSSSLIYLYQPSAPTSPSTLSALTSLTHNTTAILHASNATHICSNMHKATTLISPSDPFALLSITNVLYAALWVALVSEHGYLGGRAIVRYLVTKALWTGSVEERAIRRSGVEVRRAFAEEVGTGEAIVGKDEGGGAFWEAEDEGLGEVLKRGKVE